VLDLHAAVHDRLETGGARSGSGLLVLHAELLPEHLGANGDRVLGDRRHVLRLAEDIDHVYPVRDFPKGGVTSLAEDLPVLGIHRDDAVAMLLHVLGGEVARPEPVSGKPDHGDGAALAEDAAQGVDVVHGRNTR